MCRSIEIKMNIKEARRERGRCIKSKMVNCPEAVNTHRIAQISKTNMYLASKCLCAYILHASLEHRRRESRITYTPNVAARQT